MGVVADWRLPGLERHCLPLFGHPSLSVSLSLWRARWSAEGGRHEVADTSSAPWLSSPPPEVTLQHQVSGQVLGSEGLGQALCKPRGRRGRLFVFCGWGGRLVAGDTALPMLGEPLGFGTSGNAFPGGPQPEVFQPGPQRGGRTGGWGDALCSLRASEEEQLTKIRSQFFEGGGGGGLLGPRGAPSLVVTGSPGSLLHRV